MKYMKFFLPIIILFLSIGYAATNVTLTITGDVLVQSDIEDFDVYISDIKLNDQQDITLLKSTLEFGYKFQTILGFGIYFIDYDLTNSSKSFDAIVKTTCIAEGEGIAFTNNFESDTIIEATSTTTGTIEINAIGQGAYSISCTISATPVERNSYGEGEVAPGLEPLPTVKVPVYLKATSDGDRSDFRSDDYRESIKTITFEDKINMPDDAIASWDISEEKNGKIMSYIVANPKDEDYYDLYIQSDDLIYANKDMSYWFAGFSNLNSITNLELLNTSETTNMSYMFSYSSANNLDLTSFNTSNVTTMEGMFGAFNVDNNLNVSSFDTSNVTNMSYMFYETGYNSTNFTLDVSNFDTSNVTTMEGMFFYTGHMSVSFVTEFTIRCTTIDFMHEYILMGAASQEGSQITINYIPETLEAVETIIVYAVDVFDDKSNVVIGWNADEIFTFKIDGVTYNANRDMLWKQWLDSDHNIDGFYITTDNKISSSDGRVICVHNGSIDTGLVDRFIDTYSEYYLK